MTGLTRNASPRALRTRKALMDAGLDLMAERPIDAIPIDDIVNAAGVAKGSFFNHFSDKSDFAEALAEAIRLKIEERITVINAGVTDPVKRLIGGMCTAAEFALTERKHTIVFMRSNIGMTRRDHPLNQRLVADLDECLTTGAVNEHAASVGVLYWLGLCTVIRTNIVERNLPRAATAERVKHMAVLGLAGLGVEPGRVTACAEYAETILLDGLPQ